MLQEPSDMNVTQQSLVGKSVSKKKVQEPDKTANPVMICCDFGAIYQNNNFQLIFDYDGTPIAIREQSQKDLKKYYCKKGDQVYLYDPYQDSRVKAEIRERPDGRGFYAWVFWATQENISVNLPISPVGLEEGI